MFKKIFLFLAVPAFLLGGIVKQASAVEWKWNGYFGANYVDSSAAKVDGAFDTFAFSLIPQMKLNDQASVRAQIFFEHGPFFDSSNYTITDNPGGTKTTIRGSDSRNSGEFVLTDAYFDYKFSDVLGLRAGKFFTPFGLYNNLYYALPTFTTIKIPGSTSVYAKGGSYQTDATFYPRFSQGVWGYGQVLFAETTLSYDLYVTNGRTPEGHKDDNGEKGLGWKLGVGLPLSAAGFDKSDLSYSGFMDKSNIVGTKESQSTNLISLDMGIKGANIKTEYAMGKIKDTKMGAYYLLADYTIMEKVTPFLGYSSLDPNTDGTTGKDDKTNTTTLGINYQIIPWLTTVKLQYDIIDLESSVATDFNTINLGVATAF